MFPDRSWDEGEGDLGAELLTDRKFLPRHTADDWASEHPPEAIDSGEMEASSNSTPLVTGRRKGRGRAVLGIVLLVVVAWRCWPVVAALTGWNLRGAVIATPLSEFFLPPVRKPDEIRSGMAHPGFELPKLVAQSIFCPRAVRQGHAFWRDDPALADAEATQLAAILADSATYAPWWGEKGCGGFHADCYLRWGEGDERREVILCEGCHEALVYFGGGFVRCDLTKEGFEKISAITGAP